MKKLGIILDSFSNLTDEEARALGYGVLKLNYYLDKVEYEDTIGDFDIDMKDKFESAKSIQTSLPKLGKIEEMFKDFSSRFDDVLVIPIPSSLSGTYNACITAAKEFSNIHVIDHNFSCGAIKDIALYAQMETSKGVGLEDILENINKLSANSTTFIGLEGLEYIAKGGRLQKIPGAVLKMIKVKPIIEFKEKNSLKGFKLSSKNMVAKIIDLIEKHIGGFANRDMYSYHLMHYFDGDPLQEIRRQATEVGIKFASESKGSLVVMSHTGPTAFGLCVTPIIKK